MKDLWLRSILPIAALFALRMLGLFMLIPVFSILALELNYATPTLIGIALGAYGLSQSMLQMPLGMLSDRFGRKPIIAIGLILFTIGSIVGALSSSIYTMIIARILQGSGAIGSVLIALLTDLTPIATRTKAMAVVGVTIGLSFSFAMIVSPSITGIYGLNGIFYLTTILGLVGLIVLYIIPTPTNWEPTQQTNFYLLLSVIKDKKLQKLNIGIFIQHFILTATFYAIPILLHQYFSSNNTNISQGYFYLPLIIISFIIMMPVISLTKKYLQQIFLISIFCTTIGQFGFIFINDWIDIWLLLCFYFINFNILEAILPTLMANQAQSTNKGTAMGIYSSSQFLGIFIGGATAGILYTIAGNQGIFVMNALLSFIWFLIVAVHNKQNSYFS